MKAFDNFEEKLILKRIEQGEKEAFAEVYDFYVVKIFRFVYLKTSSKETAEDLTADTFLRCWQFFRKNTKERKTAVFQERKVGSLLYRIARNLVIDFYRQKQFKTVEVNSEVGNDIPDHKQDILSNIGLKQEVEELMRILKSLKDEYKDVLILRHIEEFSIEEISEIMGKSNGTIRVLLHRALKSLKKGLKLKD